MTRAVPTASLRQGLSSSRDPMDVEQFNLKTAQSAAQREPPRAIPAA